MLQREEVLASRKRRSEQLESILIDAKQRLDDHNSGRKLLDNTEKAALEKKIEIFQRKLETMTGELDEREVERILQREKILNERLKDREKRRQQHGGAHPEL